jgi:hypothetical protein
MMPATVNITVENDADLYQVFQYTLADGVTPISIVGASFAMGVRRTAVDPSALFFITSAAAEAGQIAIFDGPNGKFSLLITKAVLKKTPLGTWQQSLVINLPAQNGNPAVTKKIWNGTFTIKAGPSR